MGVDFPSSRAIDMDFSWLFILRIKVVTIEYRYVIRMCQQFIKYVPRGEMDGYESLFFQAAGFAIPWLDSE